jgi:hypothetical protein
MIHSRDIIASQPPVMAPTGLMFRLGLGALFLINALVAMMRPEDFAGLLEKSGVMGAVSSFGGLRSITLLIALNDAALGTLLISGKCRRFTNLAVGVYLLAITATKLLALV